MKNEDKIAVDAIAKAKTGIQGLDEITQGGLPAGLPTLVCGAAGCGKTMLALEFLLRGATQFGEPGVFMMFEETADELAANVRSLGFDLPKLCAQKKIAIDFVHVEPSEIEETGEYDLEGRFIRLEHAIATIGARRVVLDTLEALFSGLSNEAALRAELRRLFRLLKDRGMTHSNQVREFVFGDRGVDLVDVFLTGDRVLTGSARIAHQEQTLAASELLRQDQAQRQRVLASKRRLIEAQIAALRAELAEASGEVDAAIARETLQAQDNLQRSQSLAQQRSGAAAERARKAAR